MSEGATCAATCPACAAATARVRYRLPRFSIVTCAECGLVHLWPPPSEEAVRAIFSSVYATGEGSLPELRDYFSLSYDDVPTNPLVRLYEGWLARLEQHARPGRLLDVGCGTGLFLAVARRRGWEPHGVDECSEATRGARERFGVDIETEDFTAFAARSAARFDAVTMWDVLEHVRSPVALLSTARHCLAPGGIVGLATPNQRNIVDVLAHGLYRLSGGTLTAPLEKFYVPQHLSYFTASTLAATLARAGFAVVHLERQATELRRLALPPLTRVALRAVFVAARWTGLETRLFAIAEQETRARVAGSRLRDRAGAVPQPIE